MISLANQLTRRGDPTDELRDQLVKLEIEVKSAAAQFENAKLTREVAEIAVVEYDAGIFVQDRQTLDGELRTRRKRRGKEGGSAGSCEASARRKHAFTEGLAFRDGQGLAIR